MELIKSIEKELIAQEVLPKARPLKTMMEIGKSLNIPVSFFDSNDEIVRLVEEYYKEHYKQEDLAIGAIHRGIFCFKDLYFLLEVPIVYGTVEIDCMRSLMDMSDEMKKELRSSNEDWRIFIDQHCDLYDFGLGIYDPGFEKRMSSRAFEWFLKAKEHLESATEILMSSSKKQTAIEISRLATEMFFKGALVSKGYTDNDMKRKFVHNLPKLVKEVVNNFPGIDYERLFRAINMLSHKEDERYYDKGYSRRQIGLAAMSAQFVAGEVTRQISGRNIRPTLRADGSPFIPERVFP
ncbi:MAG: hypothetical protein KJ621_18940 [Proteobacteria bacterium]|nr:hypothetical protein [Pseudomonadota bacterium]